MEGYDNPFIYCCSKVNRFIEGVMDTKKFIKKFPIISEQEFLSNEIMDSLEGKGCTESCAQGCVKKNLKNNKKK